MNNKDYMILITNETRIDRNYTSRSKSKLREASRIYMRLQFHSKNWKKGTKRKSHLAGTCSIQTACTRHMNDELVSCLKWTTTLVERITWQVKLKCRLTEGNCFQDRGFRIMRGFGVSMTKLKTWRSLFLKTDCKVFMKSSLDLSNRFQNTNSRINAGNHYFQFNWQLWARWPHHVKVTSLKRKIKPMRSLFTIKPFLCR